MYQPDYRSLFLLVIGLATGLVLGPCCLGWFAPSFYQRHFVGAVEIQAELETYDEQIRERRARLVGTGATDVALEQFEREEQNAPRRALLEARVQLARREHADRFVGWAATIVIAMAVMMAGEAVTQRVGMQKNLATARYALLAVWLTIVLAVPSLLHGVQIVFGVLLVAVALLAALVPLKAGRVV